MTSAPPAVPTSAKLDLTVVPIATQLDGANRHAFKRSILEDLDVGSNKFVFEFSRCGYLDSSGLGVLVSLARSIRLAGGQLVLCGLNSDLTTLFELTRIDTLFEVKRSLDDALTAVGVPT